MYTCLVRQGNKYGPEYTEKLKKQLHAYTGMDVLIVGDGADADIQSEFTGWWSKLTLFSPRVPKPLFYLDLDSLIMDEFEVEDSGVLTVCREWNSGDLHDERIQSSAMYIPESAEYIYAHFKRDKDRVMSHVGGDQWYLQRFKHQFFPENLVGSFKRHHRDHYTGQHKIVTFHGDPKPSDKKARWGYDLWTQL